MSTDVYRLLDKLSEAVAAEARRHSGVINAYKAEITKLSAELTNARSRLALHATLQEENARLSAELDACRQMARAFDRRESRTCSACIAALEALQGEAQTTGDLVDRIRFACNTLRERGDRYELAARRYKETIARLEQQNRGER